MHFIHRREQRHVLAGVHRRETAAPAGLRSTSPCSRNRVIRRVICRPAQSGLPHVTPRQTARRAFQSVPLLGLQKAIDPGVYFLPLLAFEMQSVAAIQKARIFVQAHTRFAVHSDRQSLTCMTDPGSRLILCEKRPPPPCSSRMRQDCLSHSKWDCKYHVVFVPKRRRKAIFGQTRRQLGPILHALAKQKECQIIEGHRLPDHVHMCIAIPPKHPVASVIGFVKVQSAMAVARLCGKERNFTGEHFWAVDTPFPPSDLSWSRSANRSANKRARMESAGNF